MESIDAYSCEDAINYESDSSEFDTELENTECCHLETSRIDGSTVCMDCGLKMEEALLDNENIYYGNSDNRYAKDPSRHNYNKIVERNLHNDLEPLGFPQVVIERSNIYYKQIIRDKIYRAGNRLSIVFACVYHVYCDMLEPRAPGELAKKFKLDKKGVSNGLKTFSHFFKKRPEKTYMNAMDLIPKLLSELNIEKNKQKSCKDDINTIYEFVQTKSKLFNSSNPQSIAAGLVFYYLKLNSIPITRLEFSKVVKLTEITFTKIATDTHIILGNDPNIKF